MIELSSVDDPRAGIGQLPGCCVKSTGFSYKILNRRHIGAVLARSILVQHRDAGRKIIHYKPFVFLILHRQIDDILKTNSEDARLVLSTELRHGIIQVASGNILGTNAYEEPFHRRTGALDASHP